MRQNKKDIKINATGEKSSRRKYMYSGMDAETAIDKHKKRTATVKMKTVIIDAKTQILAPETRDSEEAKNKYLERIK